MLAHLVIDAQTDWKGATADYAESGRPLRRRAYV